MTTVRTLLERQRTKLLAKVDRHRRAAKAAEREIAAVDAALAALPGGRKKPRVPDPSRSKGGHARAAALSPSQRSEQASAAARARWGRSTGE